MGFNSTWWMVMAWELILILAFLPFPWGTGLLLFIPAFGCIFGLNIAAAKGREQLAIGLLFRLGLLLGLAVGPVIADYAKAP